MLNIPPGTDVSKKNYIDLLGHVSILQLIEHWQEVNLSRKEDAWLEYPPEDFLKFVLSYPQTPFDSIPESDNYLKPPSFLLTQTHRIWQTSSRVFKQLQETNAKRFIDFGSFPFFLPFVLRDYFGYKGEIVATVNFEMTAAHKAFLEQKEILAPMLDLDPYVSDPSSDYTKRLPFSLDMAAGSADMILSSHVVEHLYHPRSLMKEAARLLRPGGRLMITTDNAMMIDTFANYIAGYGYIFEGVESTAAMAFNFWRGHVRFFTERDLSKMIEAEGFSVHMVDFFHCFYEIFFDTYFKQHTPKIAGWKRELLREVPWMRNDICVIGTRG